MARGDGKSLPLERFMVMLWSSSNSCRRLVPSASPLTGGPASPASGSTSASSWTPWPPEQSPPPPSPIPATPVQHSSQVRIWPISVDLPLHQLLQGADLKEATVRTHLHRRFTPALLDGLHHRRQRRVVRNRWRHALLQSPRTGDLQRIGVQPHAHPQGGMIGQAPFFFVARREGAQVQFLHHPAHDKTEVIPAQNGFHPGRQQRSVIGIVSQKFRGRVSFTRIIPVGQDRSCHTDSISQKSILKAPN